MHIKITLSRDNYVYILVNMYQAELHCLAPSTLHSLHRGEKKHLARLPSCWACRIPVEENVAAHVSSCLPASSGHSLRVRGKVDDHPFEYDKTKGVLTHGILARSATFYPPKKNSATQMKHVPRPWMSWSLPKKLIDPKGVAGDVLKCNFSVPKRLVQELLLIWSMDIFLESCPPKWLPNTIQTKSWKCQTSWGCRFFIPHPPHVSGFFSTRIIPSSWSFAIPIWFCWKPCHPSDLSP